MTVTDTYGTNYKALQEVEADLRFLIKSDKEVTDVNERGALAERAEVIERLADLYKELLRLT